MLRSAYHDFRAVTVADGLDVPWSVASLPDGDMLVTERPGRLRIVRDGTLLPDPVPGVPEVFARGQGGLFDVLPHPDFATNRLLYLSYARPLVEGSTTAVVRGRSPTFQLDIGMVSALYRRPLRDYDSGQLNNLVRPRKSTANGARCRVHNDGLLLTLRNVSEMRRRRFCRFSPGPPGSLFLFGNSCVHP